MCRVRAFKIFDLERTQTSSNQMLFFFLEMRKSEILRSKITTLSHVVTEEQKGRTPFVSSLPALSPFHQPSYDILDA